MHCLLLLLLESVDFTQTLFKVLTEEGEGKSVGITHIIVLLESCLFACTEFVIICSLCHFSEVLPHSVK